MINRRADFFNFGKLLTSNVLAQALNLLTVPYLFHLYGAENFGKQAVFIVFVTLLTLVSSLKLDTRIIYCETSELRSELNTVILYNSLILCLCALIVLIPLSFMDAISMHVSSLLVPPAVLFVVLNIVIVNNCNANGEYNSIAFLRVFQPTVFFCFAYALSYHANEALNLALAYTAGSITTVFLGFKISNLKLPLISLPRYKALLGQNIPTLKYQFSAGILDAISSNFLVLTSSLFYGDYFAGVYSFVWRMLGAPISIIGGSLTRLFQFKLAKLSDYGEQTKLVNNTLTLLGVTSVVLFLPVGIVTYVLGPNANVIDGWSDIRITSLILLPLLSLLLVSSPISQINIAGQKQKLNFTTSGLVAIGKLLSITGFSQFFSFYMTLLAVVLIEIFIIIAFVIVTVRTFEGTR